MPKSTKKKPREQQEQPKRKRGRPPLQFPEPIDAEPSDVAKAIFRVNTKAPGFEWQYDINFDKRQRPK